jgi:methylthioribose-1-phosphate isomerase
MKVRGKDYRAVWMEGRAVVVVNQPLLPHRFELLRLGDHRRTARAIRTMVVRGAGTIGATAAYGLAQASLEGRTASRGRSGSARRAAHLFLDHVRQAYATLLETRPTAADLKHALDRVRARIESELGGQLPAGREAGAEAGRARGSVVIAAGAEGVERACAAAVAEAETIADEYVERGRLIGEVGLPLIESGSRILTHCNAGWLALVDWGSAPAPIYRARREGRDVFVWVDETRPRNQGANLTSWEFLHEGVPHKIIADNAAGFFMRRGEVDLCIVGADRIAANGDVANKIGTYEKAVLARENGIPFYVAAPTSTIDWSCASGEAIPIEERDESELHYVYGKGSGEGRARVRVSPPKASAANPAFDVTPARYVTGIVTEQGIFKPDALERLRKAGTGGAKLPRAQAKPARARAPGGGPRR